MNYQQTLDYLYSTLPMYQRIGKAAYKANLNNALALDKHTGHPHKQFKSIHVAGTNGKGSVSHILASIYQSAGYKTGLYTSPHLLDFRERIKVNGNMIQEEAVCDFVRAHYKYFETLKPSFFEVTMTMAFSYFADQQVDIAIIETGLGGRLDSTNIIKPIVSVITNIGWDHTQFLGNTLEAIASEKSGIIKKNIPVVIGKKQPETEDVFRKVAQDNNSHIYFSENHYQVDYGMQLMDGQINYRLKPNPLKIEAVTTDLAGSYQQENICTALQTIEVLNIDVPVTHQHILSGLASVKQNTNMLGRWQVVGHNPLTVCDCAHNREGIHALVKQLSAMAYKKLHLVLGFVNDKNVDEILSLFPAEANYYLCQASVVRSLKIADLQYVLKKNALNGKAFKNIGDGIENLESNSQEEDLVIIGGSTFLVADYLRLQKNDF